MKKIHSFFHSVSFFLTLVFIVSCSDESEEPVLGNFQLAVLTDPAAINDTVRVFVEESVEFSIGIVAEGGLNTLRIRGIDQEDNIVISIDTVRASNDFVNSFSASFDINFDDPQLSNSVIDFEVMAVDDESQVLTENVIVAVSSQSLSTNTMVLFGAQGNSNPGFYDALGENGLLFGEAATASETDSSTVDFAYYFGNMNMNRNSIAAIDDADLNAVFTATNSDFSIQNNFATRNATRFVNVSSEVSSEQFDAIVNEAQLLGAASFEAGGMSGATNLEVGNVIAFQLDENRAGLFGLIRIAQINDINGNGTITIDVKIQELDG